jgi:hypothetical protein
MAICIAGMHRSGTSLIARVLRECGVFLGPEEDLFPAGRDNRDGFWEHAALTAFNDELLRTLGGTWDDPPPLPEGWECRRKLQPLETRARELLAALQAHPPWGWKDPRNSLTLPFWRRVVEGELDVVVCVRHPTEVVRSLVARGDMTHEQAAELCVTYLRALERPVPETGRVVIAYESFLSDPATALRHLTDALDLHPEPLQVARALDCVNEPLRHHATSERSDADLPERLLAPYRALRAEANLGTAHAQPPDTETRLEAARALLRETREDMYALQDQMFSLRERLDAELEQARVHRVELGALRAESGALRAELATCAAHVGELAEELRAIKATRLWRTGTAWWHLKERLAFRRRPVG